MRFITRLKLAAAAAVIAVSSPALAVDCVFRQLDWMDSDGNIMIPFSRVGEFVFSFDITDPNDLLFLDGAYINVMVGGGDWSVQNLYLQYADPVQMGQSHPAVQFGLPFPNGQPIELMEASVSITPFPVEFPPGGVFEPKPVIHYPYHAGGFEGGGSSLSDIPFIIGPWIGPIFPLPTDIVWTDIFTTIRAVDEDVNGCAPASAARSIQYMGDVAGFTTDSAQDIYGDLIEDMGTSVGAGSTGTSVPDFLSGKDEYVDENNLPIDTTQAMGMSEASICAAADAIAAGGDVEIMIGWSGGGGHAAMITSIVKWPDGSATITYVDDPTQGDGVAENQEHVIHVNPDGTFDGGSIIGFQIETVDPLPADLDGSGSVGFGDLLILLASWGDCPGPGSCEADLDGDGSVGFSDLLSVLSQWD